MSATSKKFKHQPLVTIVLPVFNGEKFLRQALDSIMAQTFIDFELCISDNASTDSTKDICNEYAKKYPCITYHRQLENIGIFRNLEWLIKKAKGEYLLLIGDDDIYEPNCLALYVQKMQANKNVILVYSDYGWVQASGARYKSGLKIFMRAEDSIFNNLASFIRARIVLPLAMGLYRTSIARQALPFPIFGNYYKDFLGGRDIGFMWKILTKGRVDSVNKVLFYYRNKDRSYVALEGLGKNSLLNQFRIIYLNWIILTQHALKEINLANINIIQKIYLSIFAIIMFIMEYSLIPLINRLRFLFKNQP
jgi:glycosyltransferase involved in cell wall biosynthesis